MTQKNLVAVLAFSPNDDLEEVKKEQTQIELLTEYVEASIGVVSISQASLQDLQDAFINDAGDIFFFYYSGHSSKTALQIEGGTYIDSVRLANLVKGNNTPPSIVFLNACQSYAHVSQLLSVGVKAVIATSTSVYAEPAARIGTLFYQTFFVKNFTLNNAFKIAETTKGEGANSLPQTIQPHEIDKSTKLKAEWNLFVHADYPDVLNWDLQRFIKEFQQKK